MYLNQQAKLNKQLKVDSAYGEITYDVSHQIRVRKQPKVEEVTDKYGRVHRSSFEYYSVDKVIVDDKLDDKLVISVQSFVSIGGSEKMYRSLTV